MPNSSNTSRTGKKPVRPPKPYPEFRLCAHPLGYRAKKVRDTVRYVGR